MEDNAIDDSLVADLDITTTPFTAPADSSSSAANESTSTDAGTENTQASTEDTATATTAESDDTAEDTAQASADDTQTGTEDEQAIKERNRENASRRWQETQRSRRSVEQQVDQEYGPKTQEEFEAEGQDALEARLSALQDQVAYERRRNEVVELTTNTRMEAVQVMNNFPIFDKESPEYDPEFAADVAAQYQQAARFEMNEKGIVLNSELPMYDFYQRAYNLYNRGTSRGIEQGQRQVQDMMSRTENPGGSSSTNRPEPGSLEELEERLGGVVL